MRPEDAQLYGRLEAFDAIEVVEFLCRKRRTGELEIASGARTARLTLRDGGIVAAWHSGSAPLGSLLIERGFIDADHLDRALREQTTSLPPRHLGAILVDHGWLALADLEAVVEMQVRQTLYTAVSWRAGSFCFNMGEVGFDDDAVYVAMRNTETHQLLVEVVRGQDALRRFLGE